MSNRGEKFDVIVVGAGPSGLAASYTLAKAGLKVLVLERGDFPGSKNVMGGVLYRKQTEDVFGEGFWKEAPIERHVIETQAWILSEDSAFKVAHRDEAFDKEPYNSFTVLRAKLDKWAAGKVRQAGALIVTETVADEPIIEGDQVVGVRTGRPDGDVFADVVIAADGINSLLAKRAGLRREVPAEAAALAVKEVIALPKEVIEDRFGLGADQGSTIEIYGAASMGMLGTGFLYTNKETISLGVGALVADLAKTGITPNDMLEHLKAHPSIAPLIEGGETREFLGHLIPEGGLHGMPKLSRAGMMVIGDAAQLVNSMHREGSNLAMFSGQLAAQAVLRAKEWNDYSAASLRYYDQLIRDSWLYRDLYKYRNMGRFFEHNPQFFGLYPDLLNGAAREMLTVDGVSKRTKQRKIFWGALRQRNPFRMALDMFRAWRAVA